jgi:hypothetical protein
MAEHYEADKDVFYHASKKKKFLVIWVGKQIWWEELRQ